MTDDLRQRYMRAAIAAGDLDGAVEAILEERDEELQRLQRQNDMQAKRIDHYREVGEQLGRKFAEIRELHRKWPVGNRGYECYSDHEGWPCETIIILDDDA